MIRFSEVSKSFGSELILDRVSFSIAAGERVSMIGPGGCGKTTALKLLLGLLPCDSGETSLLGVNLGNAREQEVSRVLCQVGMAFQQGGLFDFQTVRQNLTFAMKTMTHEDEHAISQKIQSLLDGVKLPNTGELYPHELSGGMKRRIGIARAMCNDPKVVLFDEPTSGLDPVTSTIILNMIENMGGEDDERTMLVSTSNVEIAIRFASRLIVFKDGKIVADGLWEDLLTSGSDWVREFLGTRLIGLSLDYARELSLPETFIRQHWNHS